MTASKEVLDKIRRHGESTYPEECCGLLLGLPASDGNDVRAAWPAVNRNEDRRHDRYVIDPDDFRAGQKKASSLGLDIVGTYHSHPDHPARPSKTDLETATFPGYTYVIVSVQRGRAVDLTAWALAPDRSEFLIDEISTAP